MLIGSDTNSHSTLWGKETNNRGEQLEELIDTYNLDIHNRGKMPTYDCSLGQSIIDVTLSMDLKIAIEDWKVCKIYNHSDHHSITYTLKTDIIEIPPHRPYETAEWDILTKELKNMTIYIPEEITEQKLDKMVEKINSCIDLALDKACPLTKTKIINKNNPWWTDQLEDLRTQVTNAYKRLLINPIEGHKTRY